MQVLAIDCTAKSVSAAIAKDGITIGNAFLNIPLTHSETLMPMVCELLKNTKLTLKDIDAFAINAGPGSFTGVRIGISAIKGLAFGDKKPVFSYSALESMALGLENIPGLNATVFCLMDARCNQFYNAVFKVNEGKIERITKDRISLAKDLENELETLYNKDNVIYVGEGAKLFYGLVSAKYGTLAPESLIYQNAVGIALNASLRESKDAISPDEITPIYLRKSQAEREKEKNLKGE